VIGRLPPALGRYTPARGSSVRQFKPVPLRSIPAPPATMTMKLRQDAFQRAHCACGKNDDEFRGGLCGDRRCHVNLRATAPMAAATIPMASASGEKASGGREERENTGK